MKQIKKQAGITLMEVIGSLVIIGVVVAAGLALFNNADSSQKSTQLLTNAVSIRSSVKQMFSGQGSYGTANLNNVLVTANKLPADLKIDTTTTPNTITHGVNNGTINIAGSTTSFTITITSIPTDICTDLLTRNSGSGWAGITVGSTAVTLPTTPTAATTACSAASTNTIVFSAS